MWITTKNTAEKCSWPLSQLMLFQDKPDMMQFQEHGQILSVDLRNKKGVYYTITKTQPPSFPQVLPTSHSTSQATSFYTQTKVVVKHYAGRMSTPAQAASTCPLMAQTQGAVELCFLLCRRKYLWQNEKENTALQREVLGVKNTTQSEKEHLQNEWLQCSFL